MDGLNHAVLGITVALAAGVAGAQAGKGPAQVVKPPVAQAWIDVATFSGFGMPGMGGPGAGPMSMMSGMFGGGQGAKNTFGNTQTSAAGRWVDADGWISTVAGNGGWDYLGDGADAVAAGHALHLETLVHLSLLGS